MKSIFIAVCFGVAVLAMSHVDFNGCDRFVSYDPSWELTQEEKTLRETCAAVIAVLALGFFCVGLIFDAKGEQHDN